MYDEIVRLEQKLRSTSKKYGITDPDKRAELQARIDYLKNAHKEAVFEKRNSELRRDTLSSKLELDAEEGYGKGIDLPEKQEVRFTPIKKRTDLQKKAMQNYSKVYITREKLKEAAEKLAKEGGPDNDMYKVGRKYQLPFYLKKALGAIDGPLAAKIGAGLAGGAYTLAAEAASEGLDSEESGAKKDMPDYWLERGIKDPEEQVQRARLSSFKKDLAPYSKIPSAYEKPELRKYKEDVLRAEKEGTLRDNYVEDVQEKSDYDKFKSMVDSMKEDEDEKKFKGLRLKLA